jgi:ribosome-associated translation inhibitor RaiA/cold shock CspA family protein
MRTEITFHNLDTSQAVKEEILDQVAKLERIYDRITTCRVSVEALHNQHRTGNVYEVHVEMLVPGATLAVSREPHKAKERYASPDIHTSIRDAFRSAERQLKEYKEQLRGDVKIHVDEAVFQGQVAQLDPGEDHGFILTNTGTQLYFPRTAVMNGDFETMKRGDTVHYIEIAGDTGPIAKKVWVGPDHHLD